MCWFCHDRQSQSQWYYCYYLTREKSIVLNVWVSSAQSEKIDEHKCAVLFKKGVEKCAYPNLEPR